jgi:hypothetical protein
MHDSTQGELSPGSGTDGRPDVLVPERSAPDTPDAPEKRLMFAVLRNAIIQLRSHDAQDVLEAEHWIRDHETTAWLFSFSGICEVLGIESTPFADCLLTWRDRPTDAPVRHDRSARTRVAHCASELEGPLAGGRLRSRSRRTSLRGGHRP